MFIFSVMSLSKEADLPKMIMELLTCRACQKTPIAPPIFACVKEMHSICSECKDANKDCPSCGEISDKKKADLEEIAKALIYPCLNKGCVVMLNSNSIKKKLTTKSVI